ncbi:DNA-directed DNA polymerase alpha subunit POL12 [Aspergillus candidus]|uniref:DNA polymerase alpha subunit B n=1 Tax=Aspergillus candidus TaxID=41067 RepID=A0A2I2FBR7_ASPCN|nr:DNA polymerase alpha/primase associated subunit [Aspergillus candidus]PLB38064.1 DNA polymerase alpha/primase associated subunit [Aspergillus candidus]
MGDTAEINELFAPATPDGLPKDILTELQSILRVHSIAPQELFYKWESYCLKMGEETKMDLETVRLFKRDVQDGLERETRGRGGRQTTEKKLSQTATPRAATTSDVFGMLDGLTPGAAHGRTPNSANGAKRRADFSSPTVPKMGRMNGLESPGAKTPSKLANGSSISSADTQSIPFADRPNPGQTVETLNPHLPPPEPPLAPYSESRIKPTANTDLKKFAYKPMAMRLAEVSEILDDRIDEFTALFEKHYASEDITIGSAGTQSTSEIVAIGRVASDTMEGKLNPASLVLETSRRMGAGLRVPLNVDSIPSANFFPGQIVALRGINASGNYFSVKEVLPTPLLPPAASSTVTIDNVNERLEATGGSSPLNVVVATGPYTADDNLAFEPLNELCKNAVDSGADALVLLGPFLDIEHPHVAAGDFDLLEGTPGFDPDTATLATVFRHCVTAPLQRLVAAVPNVTIMMIPSVRDAVSRHVSWPQEQLGKKELGLPKQVRMVSNPVTLSLNETVVGISAHDVLSDLRREEVLHGRPAEGNLLSRLSKYLIEQRHFQPVFPPTSQPSLSGTGAMLDASYMKLGEWWNVRPDVLIVPSALPPFVKVVDSVLVINPGTLSKRRAPGTYAQLAIHPRELAEDEREQKHVSHKLWERGRVDIKRI